jgi:hypothetical protein
MDIFRYKIMSYIPLIDKNELTRTIQKIQNKSRGDKTCAFCHLKKSFFLYKLFRQEIEQYICIVCIKDQILNYSNIILINKAQKYPSLYFFPQVLQLKGNVFCYFIYY